MKERLKFLLYYFCFWVLFFMVARVLFLGFHVENSKVLTLETVYFIFKNGIKMDLSMAGYLSILPFLFVSFSNFIKKSRVENWIFSYTFICVFVLTLIIVIDLQVFNVWNYRLDTTPLKYLKTPREAFASMSGVPFWALLTCFLILLIVSSFLVYRKITSIIDSWQHEDNFPFFLPTSILATLALILPIRGGLSIAPMNPSTVYFSKNNFANISAINAPWNFFYSVLYKNVSKENPYQYLPNFTTGRVLNFLFSESKEKQTVIDSTIKKPNVVVIILESFNEKLTHKTINNQAITPYFNSLKAEGVYFSNIYGTGEKTEKGLIGVLSGYPAQPQNSIIQITSKSEKLPTITKKFYENGYNTSFYYGGDTEFANMKQYLYSSNFDKINSMNDFDPKDLNSKWGIHDHIVFEKAANDLESKKQPFFSTILSLSNHEPFDLPKPYNYVFGTDSDSLKYYSTARYTDESLKLFIEKAKKSNWWKNTILVIISDHGNKTPISKFKTDDFRIPMLWIGGAIKNKGLKINKVSSQIDLAKTLLNQLKLNSSDFAWSKDILNKGTKEWATFVFNDGFGMVKPTGDFTFDNIGKQKIQERGKVTETDLNQGKAMQQRTFQDYLDK
jgi:phosphoglycerol transferase MdoB-like AlkP superfamily enzyme